MKMVTPEKKLEGLILALCDELRWGLRFFYAEKVLYNSELRVISPLFESFYLSCLDQSALVLSRIVVAKRKFKDDSINIQYLLEQARKGPGLFRFCQPPEIERLAETHSGLLASYKSVIDVLEDQRDTNLTHLDLKHVNQPNWRENQIQLNLNQVEKLYQDLVGIMTIYHRLFFGREFDFGDWEKASQLELESMIGFYEEYNLKK
jgi:hypothetical protein